MSAELRARVDAIHWYHTIDLAPGVASPGWFDLRPVVDTFPWPDVTGKRCLDVGTYDGFLAFELEQRGAAEVVALDIADHTDWDWPPRLRAQGPAALAEIAGPEKGAGFRLAAEIRESKVQRITGTVYDLPQLGLGTFDVVVCGSLMLHLRDPVAALVAIRAVCTGEFLSSEAIDLRLSLLHPKHPYARLDGTSTLCQWWSPNAAAHDQMVTAAGFDIVERGPLYADAYGPAHPKVGTDLRSRSISAVRRWKLGNDGVPHRTILARPAALG